MSTQFDIIKSIIPGFNEMPIQELITKVGSIDIKDILGDGASDIFKFVQEKFSALTETFSKRTDDLTLDNITDDIHKFQEESTKLSKVLENIGSITSLDEAIGMGLVNEGEKPTLKLVLDRLYERGSVNE